MTAECVNKANVDKWASGYNLRSKLRCAPGIVPRLKTPDVSHP